MSILTDFSSPSCGTNDFKTAWRSMALILDQSQFTMAILDVASPKGTFWFSPIHKTEP